MLQLVLQMLQPASSKFLDEGQLVLNFLQGRVPLETSILFVGDHKLRALLAAPERGDQSDHEFIRNQSYDRTDWDRKHT